MLFFQFRFLVESGDFSHLRRNHCARCSSRAAGSSARQRSVSPPLPVVFVLREKGRREGEWGRKRREKSWSIH